MEQPTAGDILTPRVEFCMRENSREVKSRPVGVDAGLRLMRWVEDIGRRLCRLT